MEETLEMQEKQETKRRAEVMKEESRRTLKSAMMKGVTAETRRPAKWAMME